MTEAECHRRSSPTGSGLQIAGTAEADEVVADARITPEAARRTQKLRVVVPATVTRNRVAAGPFVDPRRAVLQGANLVFAAFDWPPIEWPLYLEAARRDLFGEGLFVTGMLATTLIPTILHLLAAGVALGLPRIGGGMIDRLAAEEAPTVLDRTLFTLVIALVVLLSWAGLVAIAIVLWHAVDVFLPSLGQVLADLALTVGRCIGGPGVPPP